MDDLAGEFADDNPHDVPQDDGDARADAEGEGIKEKVILKKMTRKGMLPKKSSLASLKAPVNAAESRQATFQLLLLLRALCEYMRRHPSLG